jgi:hypothetical protein
VSEPIKIVVDRIEGDMAVLLIGPDETRVDLPLAALPEGAREGSLLRATFVVDNRATDQAVEAVRARIERLRALSRK